MIKAAIIGYGNIGKACAEALLASPDFSLLGIIRRSPQPVEALPNISVVSQIEDLSEKPDVVLLATPTRLVEDNAKKYLSMGINTVDSFDIHNSIWELRQSLDTTAKENGAVSIISAGWDPGTDSCVRTLLEAIAPKGLTYTNFGPGMSMGHTVAVKAIEGVKDALSVTIPLGTGIHRRMVYVEVLDGYSFGDIKKAVLNDDYFIHDETHVMQVDDVNQIIDKGHGVNMVRKGVSGETHNQILEFNMSINNPAATAQIMVCSARASMRQPSGAYTLIELPLVNLLPGSLESKIKRLV